MSISQCPQVVLLFSAVANNYWKVGVGRGKGSPCRILYWAFVFVFKSGCLKRPNKYFARSILYLPFSFWSLVLNLCFVFSYFQFKVELAERIKYFDNDFIPTDRAFNTKLLLANIWNVCDENICILWCRLPLPCNAIVCWPVQGEERVVRVVWDG